MRFELHTKREEHSLTERTSDGSSDDPAARRFIETMRD